MVIHCTEKFDNTDQKYQKYFDSFAYPLSDFQKWAIYAISNGHHSLITAHTGSGKLFQRNLRLNILKNKAKKLYIQHQSKHFVIKNYMILNKNFHIFHLAF